MMWTCPKCGRNFRKYYISQKGGVGMDYLVFNFFSDTKEEAAAKLSAYLSDEQFGAVQEERKRRSNKVVTENGSQRSSTRYSSKKNLQ